MENKSKKILVIDGINNEYKQDLETYGYDLHFTFTLKEAINNILNNINYDLILVDCKHSHLRLYKLLELIRSSRETEITPVVVIFPQSNINDKAFAINIGADDVLCRPFSNQELLIKIKSLIRRSEWSKKNVIKTSFAYESSKKLSQRQLEILTLTSQGYSNKEMAELLSVTERTIKTHLHSIFEVLDIKSRTQAALIAIKEGL